MRSGHFRGYRHKPYNWKTSKSKGKGMKPRKDYDTKTGFNMTAIFVLSAQHLLATVKRKIVYYKPSRNATKLLGLINERSITSERNEEKGD